MRIENPAAEQLFIHHDFSIAPFQSFGLEPTTEMTHRFQREAYTVGWVCALPIELAAAQEMLDEEHEDLEQDENDSNIYSLGSISGHKVVSPAKRWISGSGMSWLASQVGLSAAWSSTTLERPPQVALNGQDLSVLRRRYCSVQLPKCGRATISDEVISLNISLSLAISQSLRAPVLGLTCYLKQHTTTLEDGYVKCVVQIRE